MKSFMLKMLIFGLMFMPVQYLYSQAIDLTLKYIPENNVYEVYARPDFSQNNFFLAGGSQITIVLPASTANSALSVVSVNGGPWSDNSQVYAPSAATEYDFHGIATNGSQVNLVSGTELLLFRFSLAAGCATGVRVFNNATDPGPSDPGMNGAGFGNYVGNVFTLQDHYGANYNNNGTVCGPIDDDGDGVEQGIDPDDNDPCVPNPLFATCDQDNDGLTNQEEAGIGTDPTNPDTDGDGINDGTEVDNGTNPLNPCDPNPANPACVVNPKIEFTIKFNPVTCTYEVFALPNFTQNNFFIAGGSQISLALPALAGNQTLVITTLVGGVWTDNSQVYGPGASPANDFHAISSDGSMINFVDGTEVLLFTFQLPGGVCCLEGVRLFENNTDPDSTQAGMSDGDFDNYFADIFVMDNYYNGNYNNDGIVCNECLINPVAPPTASDLMQEFCVIDAPTLADIAVNETNIRWYAAATGGVLLPNSTPLVDGTTYHAAQFDPLNNCESEDRLAIAVAVDDAPTPTTTDATQDFCLIDAPTVSSIQVNEADVVWYTAATGGTIAPANTALVNGTIYYASLTDAVTGCQSSIRLAVTITIGDVLTPTTTDATQDFCLSDAPTVADIQVNETGATWYTAATGGTIVPANTVLVNGITYYASLADAVTGCDSSERLAVTVNVGNAGIPTTTDTTQEFCLADAPTVAAIQVNQTGVVWYTAATGGTVVPNATALVSGTTYYASLTDNTAGCESATRLAVTVTVGDASTPTTADATQDFCLLDSPTVSDIQVNETGIVWYTTATGGTIIPATAALTNGTYYASLTDALTGCQSSVRLAVTVTVGDAPTPTTTDATQDFCLSDAPTIADIQVNETGVIWYTAATGGTIVPAATALVNGTTYYASLADAVTGCDSSERLAVTVNVGNAGTPTTTDTTQEFCLADAPTVAAIQVNQTGVVWYTAATGGTVVPNATALVSGTTYYASLTDNTAGCESATRLAVTVTLGDAPTPTTADATQDFCLLDAPTVSDIQVNETGIVWYTAATGGTIIPATAALTNGTYYASLTDALTGCQSSVRLAVTVTVGDAPTPTTTDATQDFCLSDAPTIADIQVNETGVVWYTAATGGTIVPANTALVNGTTYHTSLADAVTGCDSSERLAVTVNVGNAGTPTTTDTTQEFCLADAPTVAAIQVNQTGVVWYTAATGGTVVPNTTALVSGTTYYASLTDNTAGCESATRLAVSVTVGDAPTPTTADATQDFCLLDTPTVSDIQVNETGIVWYTAATGGTIIPATAALTNGTYYASLTDALTSCQSSIRLAVAVTVGDAPTPTTTDTTQDFCLSDDPTVGDIQVNETGVIWYTAPTGGVIVPAATALVSGTTYFASLTDAFTGCESATRLAVTITIGTANIPTTNDTTQQFCAVNNPTVGNIQVNETGVAWYTTATGGIALTPSTPLTDGMTYYGSLAFNGCESTMRLAVTITIEQGITPTTIDTTQLLCAVNNPTVADIQVNQNVIFYTTPTGGSVIPATTAIVSGTVYYASYTDPATGCESAVRLAITVTLSNGTTPTTNSTSQSFCETDNATVGMIQINEPAVVFYLAATGGAPLANTTPLVNNTTYYASIVDASGCASATRLAVTVTIDGAGTPTTNNTTQNFCTIDAPTIASIQVNEPGVIWYASAVGGIPLAPTDALVSGSTYYGALGAASGCASATRLAVLVTVSNGQTPTTSNAIQDFCSANNPTVADLQVNQSNVTFYTNATGGILFAATEPLVDGMLYYASYTDPVTGCPSTVRLAIQANVSNGTIPTTLDATQEFCEGELATVADLQVNESGVTWYTAATGGTPLSNSTLLTDGMTYYASIIAGNCPSAVRLAITVTVYDSTVATITGGGATACFGTEVTYTTESGNSGYIWDIAGGNIVAGGTASDNFVTVSWSEVGEGFVSVSYTDVNGCDGISSAMLDVIVTSCSDITISKTVDNTTPRINENVMFTITVTNQGTSTFTNVVVSEDLPSGYELVSIWSNMGSFTGGVWTIPTLLPGDIAIMKLEAKVVFGGNYTNVVRIMISEPIDSDTVNNIAEATVDPTCLTVFNEFSPNGDGLNDFFVIDCIENYPINSLKIFNRYGSPVYETERYLNTWDGTANVDGVVRRNEKLPVGTYYYILEIDGKAKTGWVYIMR